MDLGLASLNYFREPRSTVGFPCGSASKESACNVGDLGSIPELRRSPGEGKGYPLQYSGLENSMDCIVHGVAKSWTQLSNFHFHWGIVAVVSGLVLLPGAIKKEQVARCENSNKEGGWGRALEWWVCTWKGNVRANGLLTPITGSLWEAQPLQGQQGKASEYRKKCTVKVIFNSGLAIINKKSWEFIWFRGYKYL